MRDSLTSLADQARRSGGIDLIIPLVQPWFVPASMSILMSATGVGPDVSNVATFADAVAGGTSHDVVDTLGGKAFREQKDDAEPAPDRATCVRAVMYTWLPERGTAVIATASITSTGFEGYDQVVDALAELADSILTTVSWGVDMQTQPDDLQASSEGLAQ